MLAGFTRYGLDLKNNTESITMHFQSFSDFNAINIQVLLAGKNHVIEL